MSLKKTTSHRWVDYSGTQSEAESSGSETQKDAKTGSQQNSENQQIKNKQRHSKKYPRQDPQFSKKQSKPFIREIPAENITLIESDMVWLLVSFDSKSRQDYSVLKKKLENLKDQNPNIKLFQSRNRDRTPASTLDLCVPKDMATLFLNKGFSEEETRIKFMLHPRNFPRTNRGEDHRGNRGGRRGGNRGDHRHNRNQFNEYEPYQRRDHRNNKDRKKPVYVDKKTGEKSDNRKKFDQRVMEQNNRQYSKRRAQELGDMLGAFRNKRKQSQQQTIIEQKVQPGNLETKEQPEKQIIPEKKQTEPWKRKTENHIQQQERVENQGKQIKNAQILSKDYKEKKKLRSTNDIDFKKGLKYEKKGKPSDEGHRQKKKYVPKDTKQENKNPQLKNKKKGSLMESDED